MELSSYESYSEMQNTDDIKTSVNFYNIYIIVYVKCTLLLPGAYELVVIMRKSIKSLSLQW